MRDFKIPFSQLAIINSQKTFIMLCTWNWYTAVGQLYLNKTRGKILQTNKIIQKLYKSKHYSVELNNIMK